MNATKRRRLSISTKVYLLDDVILIKELDFIGKDTVVIYPFLSFAREVELFENEAASKGEKSDRDKNKKLVPASFDYANEEEAK